VAGAGHEMWGQAHDGDISTNMPTLYLHIIILSMIDKANVWLDDQSLVIS
jgi:hypothetical protein